MNRRRGPVPGLEIAVLLLAALATGVFFTWIGSSAARVAPSWALPLDDAYIFLRYAQQGARGEPLQWTSGEPSTGASSFLYPWLEVPAFWLGNGHEAIVSRWAFWLGVAGLGALGLGGARALRAVRSPDPWPLVGGLSLIWSGPLVFGALGGMESGLNAAAVVWAVALWIEGSRPEASRLVRGAALTLVAVLPWLRPENGAITLLAALALFAGRGPSASRLAAILVLGPGLFLAGLDLALTGHVSPAGALAKSRLGAPFVGGPLLVALWADGFLQRLLPVYAGGHPWVLPPPVGWLAIGSAVLSLGLRGGRFLESSTISWKALRPAGAAWLALLALAPLSSLVHWHYWRHHHAGLALAWILALALAAELVERWRRGRRPRWRALGLTAPLVLFLGLPVWGLRYAEAMDVLWIRNGSAATWLRGLRADAVLLVNDAGLLSLAWDGPMIDAVGLGSNGLALPFRHGPGSLLESLARRDPLPDLAAVHPEMFRIPELLGERLREPRGPGAIEIARVRTDLLGETVLRTPGRDFGLLADEEDLEWNPAPHPNHASFALTRTSPEGRALLGGCRPLPGTVRMPATDRGDSMILRATALDQTATRVVVRLLTVHDDVAFQREATLGPKRWTDLDVPLSTPGGGEILEIVRSAPGMPCLESIGSTKSPPPGSGDRGADSYSRKKGLDQAAWPSS